jgi:putative endonuclease
VGSIGETIALRFLLKNGFDVLARNFRIGKGELDLIAYQGEELVFVEIKTRSRADDFAPQLAVTPAKEEQILRLARAFRHRYGLEEMPVRFDVVAVTLREEREPKVEHFVKAF